jgi:hypothetical protein
VADQVGDRERAARRVEDVVHRPEGALRSRGLGGLGRLLRFGMDLAEREVAEGEEQAAGEALAHPADDRKGRGAVGALEVAEHDELELGRLRAVAMVLPGEGRVEGGSCHGPIVDSAR